MELKRGKTFIKSSLQLSHEKPPGLPATAPAREDVGPGPLSPGGQLQPPSERGPHVSPSGPGYSRCSSKGVQPGLEERPAALCGAPFRLVRKSRTHTGVPRTEGQAAAAGPLVGSASFPGPSGSQRMIDYRHFVPQMPFVPAVAKTLPRKRISLKRPKKCFRNLFHLRRSKAENSAPLATPGKSPPEAGTPLGKASFAWGEGPGLDGWCQDPADGELLPDVPFDLCRALCEDVASLKSFDSLTGCGEIFADESSVPSLQLGEGPDSPARAPRAAESRGPGAPAQGSAERLLSPAGRDVADLAQFWERVNRSVRRQQRALLGARAGAPQGADAAQPRPDLAELPLCACRDPAGGSKASSVDTGTPKSEQPGSVSTSDEGYYDAFSPGPEDDRQGALSPGGPAASFPRDSSSGDALYELFCDPGDGPAGPGPDDEPCASESLGAPRSLCSFRVGAEENLAPAPGPDLLSQGLLQSSWKGKDCLLKLCDTELAITMGIVNWLRRGPDLRGPPAPGPAQPTAPPGGPEARLAAGRSGPPASGPAQPTAPPGGPAALLPAGRSRASGAGAAAPEGSAPGGQALRARAGGRGPLAGASQVPPRDPPPKCVQVSGEAGTRVSPSAGPAASVSDPAAWPPSPEPRLPGDVACPRGPWRPGLTGSTLDAEPTLTGCEARVAALHIHPDAQPPAAQPPRARGLELPQQEPRDRFPGGAAVGGLSPLGTPLCSPRPPRGPGRVLDLSRLRAEPARLGAQARASGDDQPLQLSSRAPEQVTLGGQPDV